MAENKATLLVVDDIADTVEVLERNLTAAGFAVLTASSVQAAAAILEQKPVDVVVTDLKMPGQSGLDLIRHVRENFSDTATLMITGYPSLEGAVQAVKSGAEDFLPKPFTDEELLRAVHSALDKVQARRAVSGSEGRAPLLPGIIGNCETMRRAAHFAGKAAELDTPVLIVGETGVGKETLARAIHYSSKRAGGPFVTANLAAIPGDKSVAEIFGQADADGGLARAARTGTLYLKGVELASTPVQDALAERLPSMRCRVIASTSRPLLPLVKDNSFRKDLFANLSALTIELPPLCERGADVLRLIHHFAQKVAVRASAALPPFTDGALEVLRSYRWPGNVHELEAVVAHLVLAAGSGEVEVTDLPALMRFSVLREGAALRTLEEVEAEHIARVLEKTEGNRSRAAEILGIDRKTLRDKMKKESRRS